MLPNHRIPEHPGVILKEEFLEAMGITQVALAQHIGVPIQRVNEIVNGKRGITPDTAWLLAQALGTSAEFWARLQSNHDLASSRPSRKVRRLRRAS